MRRRWRFAPPFFSGKAGGEEEEGELSLLPDGDGWGRLSAPAGVKGLVRRSVSGEEGPPTRAMAFVR